jgi:hypothetical protein
MIYPGEGKKGQPKAGDYVLAAEQTRAEAAASPHRSTAFDLARADKWEGQARTWKREAANVRACRLAGVVSRLSATYQQGLLTLQRKRTGGNQHVTVKHIHQQVNVTEGGQAVVAGETVTRGQGERRRGIVEK